MYLTTIAGGSGDTYQDVQGRTLRLTGNDRLWPGRRVWTDGHYCFSSMQQADVPADKPVITNDGLIFPYLTAYGSWPGKMIYKYFTKDFIKQELAVGYGDGIFIPGRKSSYLITDSLIYDLGSGKTFATSYDKDKTHDACVDVDGNLIRLIEDSDNSGEYYALVYRNNDLVKKHTFQITEYSWVTWQYAKVRPDGSFYGIYWTHESPNTKHSERPITVPGMYRQYQVSYTYSRTEGDATVYDVSYTYAEKYTDTTIIHYESEAASYKDIAFFYDSRNGERKDVWVKTVTGGNVQARNYIKDENGNVKEPRTFDPHVNTMPSRAGYGIDDTCTNLPAGLYYDVEADTGIKECTGTVPAEPYFITAVFEHSKQAANSYLKKGVTITGLVVYVDEPLMYPQITDIQSQPFDFPTSDTDVTEPMHCHVKGYMSVDWNCLGLIGKNGSDFIRDSLKIGGKTYAKKEYSALYDASNGKEVVNMSQKNYRIKATGMKNVLHENIEKTGQ